MLFDRTTLPLSSKVIRLLALRDTARSIALHDRLKATFKALPTTPDLDLRNDKAAVDKFMEALAAGVCRLPMSMRSEVLGPNYGEAMLHLTAGGRVNRPEWGKGYLCLTGKDARTVMRFHASNEPGFAYVPTDFDMVAHDWRLF